MSPLPTTYTTAEVAEAFHVEAETVRDWVKQGKVKPLQASNRAPMRFTDEQVAQLVRALTPAAKVDGQRRRRRRAS